MTTIIVIAAGVVAIVLLFIIIDQVSSARERVTIAFLEAHGLTYDTYNGAGCAAQTLSRVYKKTGDADPSHWIILAGPLDFQLATYGRYPRNSLGFPIFCGVEILYAPTQGFAGLGNLGRAVRFDDPRVALARQDALAYFERAAADKAKRAAQDKAAEDKALRLLERALRNVATDPTTAGALVAAALA
jgi:hypothetical protein